MGRTSDEGLTSDSVAAVRAALGGIADATAVVLAMSGGPDSLGMAWLVSAARSDLRITVVHVRHGLRDDASDADVTVAQAEALGRPVRVLRAKVTGGAGPEDAARQARLTALCEAAVAAGARFVLTGHTADDQAETVLLNIARGAGLPGLAGMAAQRPLGDGVILVHPVLGLRRAVVRSAAEASGLLLAVDPTNSDAQQRRARARADLLPALSALTGGHTDPVEALARLARHARRDTAALDAMAVTAFEAVLLRWGPVLAVTAAALDALTEAIASRVVRLLLQRVGDQRHPPSADAVDDVLSLTGGRMCTLAGGVLVSRGGGWLAAVPGDRAVLGDHHGPAPVGLPELGVTVRQAAVATDAVLPPWAPAEAATSVALPAATQLQVRPRRPGDRIVTAAGTQSVADAMVSAGVPRTARALVPVISDPHGVLWVPGVAVRAGHEGAQRLYLTSTRAK